MEVEWNSGEWKWPLTLACQPPTPFFQYIARIGRRSLVHMKPYTHARSPHWTAEGIFEAFLQSFWVRFGTFGLHGGSPLFVDDCASGAASWVYMGLCEMSCAHFRDFQPLSMVL